MALLPFVPALNFKGFYKTSPDLILYNANIITVNPARPKAEALAIIGDRIVAVGSNREVQRMASSSTKKVNIGGKTITPGFIDAHSHPASAGVRHLRNVDCDLRSIKEIQQAVHARALKTPPGEWVQGFKYDDTKTREGRALTFKDLDEAAPDHPVLITHRGGHSAYANSKAIALANFTRHTPDPEGGRISRDSKTGELTGQFFETAVNPIRDLIPNQLSRKDWQDGSRLISQMMTKVGLTSVHDAGGTPEALLGYQDAYKEDELLMRLYCMIRFPHLDEITEAGIRPGSGNEWVRVAGIKLVCDGSISERTARLAEPYIGRPDDYGIIIMDEEELYTHAIKAHKADWQIGIHANGEVGISKALNVYERLQKEHQRKDPRFRLEHCSVVNDEIISRIKALNAIPNPFSTYVYYHGEKMKEYGEERLERMMAVRSFLDAGIKVTQTSDYVPGPFEPMMALQSSVTRTDMHGKTWGPSQRISVEEAIKVGTLHGAYASFEENIKGSLVEGKLSDLVVLGEDPTKTDPLNLVNIPIERTMVGGKWVYES